MGRAECCHPGCVLVKTAARLIKTGGGRGAQLTFGGPASPPRGHVSTGLLDLRAGLASSRWIASYLYYGRPRSHANATDGQPLCSASLPFFAPGPGSVCVMHMHPASWCAARHGRRRAYRVPRISCLPVSHDAGVAAGRHSSAGTAQHSTADLDSGSMAPSVARGPASARRAREQRRHGSIFAPMANRILHPTATSTTVPRGTGASSQSPESPETFFVR